MFWRNWYYFTWRHWCRAPWQYLLLLFILALGVGTFLSIRLANRVALEGFGGFAEVVRGQSDATIVPLGGYLPVEVAPEIRRLLGDRPVHLIPMRESTAVAAAEMEERAGEGFGRATTLRLLGIDLLGIQNVRPPESEGGGLFGGPGEDEGRFRDRLRGAPDVFVAPALAERWQLEEGEDWALLVGDEERNVRVVGILPDEQGGVPTPGNLVVMDITGLFSLIGGSERLQRIDLVLPPDTPDRDEVATELREELRGQSAVWTVQGPDFEERETASMTAAFRLNLTILSLIALLTGVYLISQALDAAVVRRRQEIGILRSLGVTDREMKILWWGEIGLLGLAGSLLGILVGRLLAVVSTEAVSQTVNTLYRTTSPTSLQVTTSDIWAAFLLGLGASFLAGWIPLRDALKTPPAQVLARGNWRPGLALLRNPWTGFVLLILGLLAVQMPPLVWEGGARFPLGGYAAALLWLVGGTFLVGAIFPLMRPLSRVIPRVGSIILRPALARLGQSSTRHRLAAAGLFIATAMAGAMSLLVASFSHTMEEWIERRFQADVYLNAAGAQSADSDHLIRRETWEELVSREEVRAADPFRSIRITLRDKITYLTGAHLDLVDREQNFLWLVAPDQSTEWYSSEERVVPGIINEAFAERFGTGVGQVIEVPTPMGTQSVRVVAMQADYGNEQGALLVDRRYLREWVDDDFLTNLTIFLHDGVDADGLIAQWQEEFPGLAIRSNRALRETALGIFRQTFAITHSLKVIAVLVALIGLALTLVAILRESIGEWRVLRHLGMSRRELSLQHALEGGGIAAAGAFGGLVFSFVLGWLLVFVINKQSFGWTLLWQVPIGELILLVGLVMASGILVSYFVSRLGGAKWFT